MRIVRTMSSLEDAGRLGDITAFEAECRQATTLDQLKSLLDAIVRQFGFRWFALVHNVDLKRTTRKALLITTYPARWVEEVIDARLPLADRPEESREGQEWGSKCRYRWSRYH